MFENVSDTFKVSPIANPEGLPTGMKYVSPMQELPGTTHVMFPTAFVKVAMLLATQYDETVRFWFDLVPAKKWSSSKMPPLTDAAKHSATADVRARGSSLFIEPLGD
jgi:hypothetical protein